MGVIAKQTFQSSIISYVGIAIGLFTTFFVLTKFLAAEDIGLMRVLIDATTIFISLAQLGTNNSINRYFPFFKDEKTPQENGFFFWTLLVPAVGFALFATLYCILHNPICHWFGEKSQQFVEYYYFVLPMGLFMLYQNTFAINANVLQRSVFPRFVQEVLVRIGLLVVYLLYAFHFFDTDGYVIGLCATYGAAMLANFIFLLCIGKISFAPNFAFVAAHPEIRRSFIQYTLFLVASALAGGLASLLSSFFVTAKIGLAAAGIYAIANNISYIVSISYRSLAAIATPQLAIAIKENNTNNINRLLNQTCNNMLLVSGLIFLLLWTNIDTIFLLLPNGATYQTGQTTVFILCILQLITGMFSLLVPTIELSRYYFFTIILSLFLTAFSVVLNNYFTARYGMAGAALGSTIAYSTYYLVISVILFSTMRVHCLSTHVLKSLILLTALFALNALWTNTCTPHIRALAPNSATIHIAENLIKSILLTALAAITIVKAKLSPELLDATKNFIARTFPPKK